MSPRYIMVGFNIDYARHCKLEFGALMHRFMTTMIILWPPELQEPLPYSLLETNKVGITS
jgi:hypothetical protein